MGVSLESFARGLDTSDVTIRGSVIKVRRLSSAETSRLGLALLRPRPTKYVKDPSKGSEAPLVLDHDDPAHKAAMSDWHARVRAAEAAVAMDFRPRSGIAWPGGVKGADPATVRAWTEEAAAEVMEALDDEEIMAVWRACSGVRAADEAETAEEQVVKNS